MKIFKRMIPVLGVLALTACESVFVEQPLGEEVVVLEDAAWQGQWSNGEVVITTSIIDADKGILQAAWLERGEHGAELEMATGYVRRTGERIYLNLPKPDPAGVAANSPDDAGAHEYPKDSPREYHWARLVLEDHQAQMWWPNQERFRDAVKAGTLPGRIKDDQDVVLGALSTEQLDRINSPEANMLNWEHPMVFIRVAD